MFNFIFLMHGSGQYSFLIQLVVLFSTFFLLTDILFYVPPSVFPINYITSNKNYILTSLSTLFSASLVATSPGCILVTFTPYFATSCRKAAVIPSRKNLVPEQTARPANAFNQSINISFTLICLLKTLDVLILPNCNCK